MSRLGNLNQTLLNAIGVLRRPKGNNWRIFQAANGKRTAVEIGKLLTIDRTNVAHALTFMANKGLLEEISKKGQAPVYAKIPELRNTNLVPYFSRARRDRLAPRVSHGPTERSNLSTTHDGIKSKSITKVIEIGTKYEIQNIDQNWVDALVILNFIETACTKFLMDHGFTEEEATDIKWDQKINAVQNKLFQEASAKGIRPRPAALAALKNYRDQRNIIDHQAHVSTATVEREEVTLLMQMLRVFVKEVFERHKSYCSLE